MLTQGLTTSLPTTNPPLTGFERSEAKVQQDLLQASQTLQDLSRTGNLTLYTANETLVFPPDSSSASVLDQIMSFNPLGSSAQMTSNVSNLADAAMGLIDDTTATFTGADMTVLLDIVTDSLPANIQQRMSEALVECSTLTVSVHRAKSPVRACSYINAKGFARGRRTIAGTLILIQFTVDVLFCFLQAVLPNDYSKDTTYVKIDQLRSFNLTLLFADEYGNASYRRLLGVDFITDGTIYPEFVS